MDLVNLDTYYSFPNLSDENNVFRYSPGSSQQEQWVDIRIPEGSYDLIDIAETIKISMKRNGHNGESIKITANTNTLKSVMEFSNDFIVDFRVQVFSVLQGTFTKKASTNHKMSSTSYQ